VELPGKRREEKRREEKRPKKGSLSKVNMKRNERKSE
jgi:hypothetical protein